VPHTAEQIEQIEQALSHPIPRPAALEPLQVVLEVLLRELPTLDLAVPVADLRAVEGLVVGGMRELPVTW
jgi:hypothetical protein